MDENGGILQVSAVSCSGAKDLQICWMPVELIAESKGSLCEYINLKLKTDLSVICQVIPTVGSYRKAGYQVVVCNCVLSCSEEAPAFHGSLLRKVSDVQFLQCVPVRILRVTIILKSVDDILKYRKHRTAYVKNLLEYVGLFGITSGCTILCDETPLAVLLGIAKVLITSCDILEHQVGKVSLKTQLVIDAVESEDRRQLKVEKGIPLGGLDNVIQYLKRLILDPWTKRKEFDAAGVQYPSGILLVGPPGCGKTSLVRHLCAETSACLVAVTGANLISPYAGETEKNFRKAVEKACMLSEEGPCLFFIDEIDSLCPARTKESSLHSIRVTSQVLLSLDRCQSYRNLTAIAATNRPYCLDPAVRRSGRLEVEILLNVPTVKERMSILEVHSEGLLPSSYPRLREVAKVTPGFVGADLQFLASATGEHFKKESTVVPSPDCVIEKMLALAQGITPSIHKTLEFITTKPAISEVGGLDDVKEQLHQVIMQHTEFADVYHKLRLRRPRGILLYGPRGCGKTRLVSNLASHHGFTFISANASHLLSPYVGESEKRVAALFHTARLSQPTVLFIDEIDGIFRSRERAGTSVGINLLTELLQAMDGADISTFSVPGEMRLDNTASHVEDGVLVCAATNHPGALDPALLRPGRFDKHIYIPLPDYKSRLQILKIKTSRMDVEDNDDCLKHIAEHCEGYTGAEIENIVCQAAILAVQKGDYDKKSLQIHISRNQLKEALSMVSPSVTEKEIQSFIDFKRND